jgi:hypothetical protein
MLVLPGNARRLRLRATTEKLNPAQNAKRKRRALSGPARDLFRFTRRRYSGSTRYIECSAEGFASDGHIPTGAKKPHNVSHSRAGHAAGTLDTINASSTWISVSIAQKRLDRNSGYCVSFEAKRGLRQRLLLAWASLPSRASSFFKCRVLEAEDRQKQAARSQGTEAVTQRGLESIDGVGLPDQKSGRAIEEACAVSGTHGTKDARMNLSR